MSGAPPSPVEVPRRPGPARLRIGIDEAGYGPILGPLVVSGVAVDGFEGQGSLWDALQGAVSRRPAAGDARIVVSDSKVVHRGPRGFERLERSVLAVLAASGVAVPTLGDLLGRLAPTLGDEADQPPWYREWSRPLPSEADAAAVASAADRLRAALGASGTAIRDAASIVLTEVGFNRRVDALGNKAAVAFEAVGGILAGLWDGRGDGVAVVDRQGGRSHYAPLLRERFEESWVWIVREDAECSAYRIDGPGGSLEASFEVRADSRHFEVALASMISKYVRELLMRAFNRYWRERCPSAPWTTGYWEDGHTFLAAVAPCLEREGVRRDDLVRSR